MNGIWYYIIAFFIIWTLAYLFKDKLNKKGVEADFPILMWRTNRFRSFIDNAANKFPKFWKWYMNIGVVVSFIAMFFVTFTLFQSLSTLLEAPSVSIILPGVDIPGSPIKVPLISGLIALATVLIVHEFSHGILSRVEKINVKSIGILLFAILPGAFVEPDEDELLKAKKSSKLRIYAAGSIANMSLAAVALILFYLISFSFIPTVFDEDGFKIVEIVDDSPASKVLSEGMVVESVNNQSIDTTQDYMNFVESLKPNQNITLGTNQGDYSLTLAKNPDNESRGFMGFAVQKNFVVSSEYSFLGNQIPYLLFGFLELFQWIFVLNLGIGLFNLLPIGPLDGGRMFELLLSYKLSENQYKPIVKTISILLVSIILFSLLYGIIVAI